MVVTAEASPDKVTVASAPLTLPEMLLNLLSSAWPNAPAEKISKVTVSLRQVLIILDPDSASTSGLSR